MKKILLLASAALVSISGYAQTELMQRGQNAELLSNGPAAELSNSGLAAKGTGITDTLFYRTAAQQSGPYSTINFDYAAPVDSGKLYGMNAGNYKGYAQLYRFSTFNQTAPQDTTIRILGIFSRFWGTKSNSSTKSIVFSLWNRTTTKTPVTGRTKFFMYGLPGTLLPGGTKSVPFSSVNLITGTTSNPTVAYFAAPVTTKTDVYAGYTVAYTWGSLGGDTIGLLNTQTAASNSASLETGTGDTLVNVNNVLQTSTNAWRSIVYDMGITNGGDQVIYPIIQFDCPTCSGWTPNSVSGMTRNGLTMFGNYPNPAINSTNIKIALTQLADVTITVMDVTGKTINTITKTALAPGDHAININTAALSAGNYIYTVETSKGDGMAAQFTVAK